MEYLLRFLLRTAKIAKESSWHAACLYIKTQLQTETKGGRAGKGSRTACAGGAETGWERPVRTTNGLSNDIKGETAHAGAVPRSDQVVGLRGAGGFGQRAQRHPERPAHHRPPG